MTTDSTSTDGPPNRDLERRLHDELAAARYKLSQLEAEYAELLADPGTIQEDRDNTRRLLEAARGDATTAEHALDRLHSGTYGRCQACGEPIAPERLEAVPDTTTCVRCA